MKVGSLEEAITVSGASPIVDTQNVRSQNVLSRQASRTFTNAEVAPLGRNLGNCGTRLPCNGTVKFGAQIDF